ncbi:BREX-1 system adenine-specific DNA-methyltransferase PglX [Phascolarctobacterium succinatutens]|uniref:BREX-1 system adenine-specific DNA-methyltransferase PglX n=1 Tax=Phascolarctobacterium succinatutens TaxID=626940 RepID=UPI0030775120
MKQENFAKIPGAPVAYWVSENVINAFTKGKLQDYANVTNGLFTCNNNLFLRLWSEISYNKFFGDCHDKITCLNSEKKWYPYNKGGNFRKWYGNQEYVVNFSRFGEEISNYRVRNGQSASFPGQNFYFNSSLSWSLVTSGSFAIRYYPKGFVFDIAGSSVFSNNNSNEMTLLGFLGSCVARNFLCILNPTLNYQAGNIRSLPIINDIFNHEEIEIIVKDNIVNSIKDWDAFETSWDFTKHPLLRNKSTISEAYAEWEAECNTRFAQLKANEEELNRIFIDIYGLQDELTPEVEDKDVTVRKADLQRDIKSLLSYAVGCMFGRYSLDVEGLAYAGGEWDESKYITFKPDEDNVIPITDEDYFEDDIIGRLIAWLKVVYGAETLEENLRFIADALGTSGDTARQKIRNYFLKDFFKDHCKIYQKRPIYWLYDSGKQNGFKALIYMHRYNADTSGQVRAEYLGKMEETYESEINRMQDIMDNGAGREVALAGKRKEKLQKQLHECRDYDAVLGHIALASIAIDLDDGVKVNYVKVQTAKDGKLLPILAKI